MAAGYRKPGSYEPPSGSVRQSQVLTSYGAGAMIDLVDRSVLVRGLDFWRYAKTGAVEIKEARFADALSERFKAIGRELARDRPFRAPPAGNDREPSRACGIQALTFPWWYLCQNPACRALLKVDATTDVKGGRYLHDCTPKGVAMVPVRFVGACKRGHLQDYPWRWFAHRNHEVRCDFAQLSLQEGATGDFSEIRVSCRTCGASEPLVAAQAEHARPTCEGRQPWLGAEAQEQCTESLRLLVRTASNAYFAQTESALALGDGGEDIYTAVSSVYATLKNADTIADIQFFRHKVDAVRSGLGAYDDAAVLETLKLLKEGKRPAPEPIRSYEYKAFLAQPVERPGEAQRKEEAEFFARRIERGGLPKQIERVVLARKLREVMVQLGFTRLEFPSVTLSGEFDLKVEQARLGLNETWLPAIEVRGEGIFIRLDEAELESWLARPAVKKREVALRRGYSAWAKSIVPRVAPPFPGARYYLLHSLSHMLMTAISLECGYPASSIRERLYCSEPDDPMPHAAILLATGTPGAEGTLGGLVEQGNRLLHHLQRAHDEAQLCSSDPVCAHHTPEGDPAERFLEGAACHGCLFVAECSCERFNRLLDRSLVVPTLGQDLELAFFRERP